MLLLDLAFQQIAELLQALKTKRFREFIVRAAFCRHLDLSDLQIESRGLALQIFGIVILGESDFDRLFLASLYADELIFEAGNQIAGTDENGHPLARTKIGRASCRERVCQ